MVRIALFVLLLAVQDRPPDLCELSGSVVNSLTGEPLSRVQLHAEPVSGGRAATTTTDVKGKFKLIDLEPGQYRLLGKRNGYLEMYYGARRPEGKATLITLAPGQQAQELRFKLTPFSVIAGTVRESDGEPLTGAWITLLRREYYPEGSQWVRISNTQTDDLGQYRLFDLLPGRYYLRAAVSLSSHEDKGDDHGPKDAAREILAGAIYGGASSLASARPIEVDPGARISGIDITLPRVRVFRVSGRVSTPEGTSAGVGLSAGGLNDRGGESYFGRVKQNGDFDIAGVPAGSYTLYAEAPNKTEDRPADGRMYFDLNQPLRAAMPVEVGNHDVGGLRITVEAGGEIVGRASVEGGGVHLSGLTVVFRGAFENNPMAFVKADETFLAARGQGHYEVMAEAPEGSKNLVIKSIRSADADILREGLTIQDPAKIPLEIVFAPEAGELDGVAFDKDENPASGATIVAVPDMVFRRRMDRFFAVAADQQGRFHIKDIPPGEYRLFAWDDVEPNAWFDPEFLRPIEAHGEPVKLDAKGHASVKVHLAH